MLRASDVDAIRARTPFSEMDPRGLEQMVEASYLQRFPAGTQLIEEGDPAEMLHLLLEGTIDLYGHYKSKESTLILMQPVRAFILAAVVHDLPYLMSARSLTPVRILMIPATVTHELLANDRAFYAAMLRELASEFRRTLKALKSQKLRDGTERIAAFLLELQQAQGGAEAVSLPADRKTIASYLGMTRENLSRSLQKIGNYGAAVRGNEVVLRDPEKLRAHAAPSPLMDEIEDGPPGDDE